MTGKLRKSISTGELTKTHQELSSECRLWRQVISQAISDAYLDDIKHKQNVFEWLDTDDFDFVCDLAFMEANRLKKFFLELQQLKPPIARFKGRKFKELIDKI
tara:strand:- start:276 stop:584 length:309 start_codon:yes stop_codon:yes gene_type:complete